jgi:hypothetical protein
MTPRLTSMAMAITAIAAATMSRTTSARADDGIPFGDMPPPVTLPQSDASLIARRGDAIRSDKANAEACLGVDAVKAILDAHAAYEKARQESAKRKSGAEAAVAAQGDVKAATTRVEAAKSATADAERAAVDAGNAVDTKVLAWVEAETAAKKDPKNKERASKAASALAELDAAVKARASARQHLADKATALATESALLATATAAAQKAEAASAKDLDTDVAAKADAFRRAFDKLPSGATAFQRMVDADASATDSASKGDAGRLRACSALAGKLMGASEEHQAAAAPEEARQQDTLRKAATLASVLGSGNGLAEQAGAPDRIIFSLMTAAGADKKTNGTQAVLTLNLASLFESGAKRVDMDPLVRNLTLRAVLPLSSTEATPVSGAAQLPSGSAADATRFSLTLGGSLLDHTDPRTEDNAACYRAALAYTPFQWTPDAEEGKRPERQELFDICNRQAASRARLAWRFGVGLLRPSSESTTKAEVLAGALVWSPNQYTTIDLLYQRLLEPGPADVFGGAISVAGNVGGTKSGVSSWGRVGVDFVLLGGYTHESRDVDMEFRVTPTFRAKVLTNAFAVLGLGPRFVASRPGGPDLLATFAVTYDADALMDQLLTRPAAGTSAGK